MSCCWCVIVSLLNLRLEPLDHHLQDSVWPYSGTRHVLSLAGDRLVAINFKDLIFIFMGIQRNVLVLQTSVTMTLGDRLMTNSCIMNGSSLQTRFSSMLMYALSLWIYFRSISENSAAKQPAPCSSDIVVEEGDYSFWDLRVSRSTEGEQHRVVLDNIQCIVRRAGLSALTLDGTPSTFRKAPYMIALR